MRAQDEHIAPVAREWLPVHGFVLAGGKSSRMGRDKALMELSERPMVQIAVEKLRSFCKAVSIAGNREDLLSFAPVTREHWLEIGPIAGVEAGLQASTEEWAVFIPVDVPLVPATLLREWVDWVVSAASRDAENKPRVIASCLRTQDCLGPPDKQNQLQPSFCLLHRDCQPVVAEEIRRGTRRLEELLRAIEATAGGGSLCIADVEQFSVGIEPSRKGGESWFLNVNTPQDLARAEVVSAANISLPQKS